jgi:hypothetical protein
VRRWGRAALEDQSVDAVEEVAGVERFGEQSSRTALEEPFDP